MNRVLYSSHFQFLEVALLFESGFFMGGGGGSSLWLPGQREFLHRKWLQTQ